MSRGMQVAVVLLLAAIVAMQLVVIVAILSLGPDRREPPPTLGK